MPTNNREETDPKQTEGAAALEPDVALRDALEDVVADVVGGLEAVLVVHILQHELVEARPRLRLAGAAERKELLLPLVDLELVERLVSLIEVDTELVNVD